MLHDKILMCTNWHRILSESHVHWKWPDCALNSQYFFLHRLIIINLPHMFPTLAKRHTFYKHRTKCIEHNTFILTSGWRCHWHHRHRCFFLHYNLCSSSLINLYFFKHKSLFCKQGKLLTVALTQILTNWEWHLVM